MDWIGLIGQTLHPLVRHRPPLNEPKRVLVVKLCCIGDVIFATPMLDCLRRAWPDATIEWLVGKWSAPAVENHPALKHVIHARSGWRALARQMADYDLLVVPDRSSQLSLAALRSRVPHRAGLDSAGRGFGYTVRAPIDPDEIRHEADIYLDVARALGLETAGCRASFVPTEAQVERVANKLTLGRPFAVIHPAGGNNPGMYMPVKRWAAANFAALAERCVTHLGLQVMVVGGPNDGPVTADVLRTMRVPAIDLTGQLSLGEVAALAQRAAVYIGNDTGLSHMAAAAGAHVLMIFGPSDPRRYGPFAAPDRVRYVWRPVEMPGGVNAGPPPDFDWVRDGVSVEEVWAGLLALLGL
ncbi:MAG: glycosyltransferase family 9 protein [Anaerolineae bacterium]|nr:glycosyltransferase family 9 protein [Anaerolineae bacterium]